MVRDVPNYTKEQKQAIEHDKNHLRIIACAGSGKTQVISERLANLIKKGVSPKEIVAFTFTIKAAEELKSRIRYILDHDCPERADFGDMYVGTIDAFCFQILQEIEPYYKNYDVLEGAKRVAYLSKSFNVNRLKLHQLRQYGKTKRITLFKTIERFITSSDIMMMEEIDPENLTNEDFKYSYLEYRKLLEEDKYLDFPSMIRILIHKLETDPEAKAYLHSKAKHLIVDEYQDINKIQEHLIEIISEKTESLCVVGDDDQCIYQWRGSHVNNIISFEDRYKAKGHTVTNIPLNINFRSTMSVIHTAREFIKNNKKRLQIKEMDYNKELKRNHEDGDIIFNFMDTENEEMNFILNKINQLKETDYIDKKNKEYSLSYGDVAVLVRTNTDASRILEFLRDHGIDCLAYSGTAVFTTPEVQFAMNCMSYVFDCQAYNYQPTPSIEDLKKDYEIVFDKETYSLADTESFVNDINIIKSKMAQILNKSPRDYLGDLGLQAVYHKILSTFGAQRFDFSESYHYHFAVLSTAISDYESVWKRLRATEVNDFFQFAKAFGEGNYTETQYENAALMNAVKILTIHKAKGLEFPVVFVPGMRKAKRRPNPLQVFIQDSLFPRELYDSDEEDERRVFYTAFTRSEKYLLLSGTKEKTGAKSEYEPHPFVAELDKKFISNDMELKRNKSGFSPRALHEATFPTSFSELTTYDRCPQDFWIRNVCGYNAGVPAAFGYGTNIHNILNIIHNNYLKSGTVPTDHQIEHLIENVFYLRYATDAISLNMKKGAKKIIKNYVKIQKREFRKILETEKRFEFVVNEAVISGQIDLLKKLDESGRVEEVEIIDFKTEKDKGKKPYEMNYHKQLRLYALACLKSLGLSPKRAVIHHLDKNLLNTKTKVDISEENLNTTKNEIAGTVSNIIEKKFIPRPGKLCKDCDYKYICSKKSKTISF